MTNLTGGTSGHGTSPVLSSGQAGLFHPHSVKAHRRWLQDRNRKPVSPDAEALRQQADEERRRAENCWFAWGMGMWARFTTEDSAARAVRQMQEAFPGEDFTYGKLDRPGSIPDCDCCGFGGGRLHDGRLPWDDTPIGGAA